MILDLWRDLKMCFKLRPEEIGVISGVFFSLYMIFEFRFEMYLELFKRCPAWFETEVPFGQYAAVMKGRLDILWEVFGWMFTLVRDLLAFKLALMLGISYFNG